MKTPPAPKYKMLKVRADKLQPHPDAQREISNARVKKLMTDFDLDAVGTIHAVEYPIKGKSALWIVDGQHRWRALMDLGFGEWEIDVKLHLGVRDEASASGLFLKLNDRLTVRPFDKFKNRLQAKDDDAVAVNDIVLKHGLRISANSADGCIVGIASLEKTYRMDEGEALDKTLGVTTQAWGKRPYDAKVIEGIGMVFARFNGTIDQPAMVKKLAKYPGGSPGLIGDARGLMEFAKKPLARCIAERVIDTYNLGRRIGKLDPL
jgi:hypothetical protein